MYCLNTFIFIVIAISSAISEQQVAHKIPHCPVYSRPMLRPNGDVRKCLPHQLNLCLNALEDSALIDTSGICCYHNQVDYFCCMDIPARLCPSYRNVTVVIHNNFPQSQFPVRSFHFRKGVEKEIADGIRAAAASRN
uniref:Uncharacterized protein n=1 Tax=Meloidogyne enterolobii TaxID=390850 RepID=A0A6V7XPN6_MELEN|nr:unnamed protein product [Meloidogyne enterolobii]